MEIKDVLGSNVVFIIEMIVDVYVIGVWLIKFKFEIEYLVWVVVYWKDFFKIGELKLLGFKMIKGI